jgi:16S rRNA (cytidine1402-2'-O)-methyltransferase
MLVVVATPVGNLEDMAPRALRALREADAIACEDTRRTRILLDHFAIPRPRIMFSYRQGIEERAGGGVLALLREGRSVALCSDGGYPGLSDPGYRLVAAAIEAGCEVDVIPGASAIPLALLLSGLPTSSYTFKGYPPRRPGPRARFFEDEREQPHTLVVFESPHRVADTLAVARVALGDRRAAVCIELTKKFQRVSRGHLGQLAGEFTGKRVRGEVTVVIAGSHPKFTRDGETAGDGEGDGGEEPACAG